MEVLEELGVDFHHHPLEFVGRGGASWRGSEVGDSVIRIGELWPPLSPSGAAPAIEVVERGPSPADTNGVEALGGFSMKLGSLPSTTGAQQPRVLLELAVLELEEGAVLVLGEGVVKRMPPLFFW